MIPLHELKSLSIPQLEDVKRILLDRPKEVVVSQENRLQLLTEKTALQQKVEE